jgi:ABC-type phosphate/phosphonate transport system ATPase subunit
MFGLTIDRLADRAVLHACRVTICPGDIVFIVGPSGAGKSVLLGELARCVPAAEAIHLDRIELPEDRTVIDCFDQDVIRGLQILSRVGLSDVFSLLNRPARLSEGQKYRLD